MLAMISLGILALTLNWFDVATAFPLIGAEFRVGLGSLSYLISLYIVGYGLAHIPSGMLATAIGMKRTLVLGLLVQGLAGIMSGTVAQLHRARLLPRRQRHRRVGVHRCGYRGGRRLVPRQRRHARARHLRRGRLQRGRRLRPLRLDLRPARDGLAHLADAGRCLRAAGHAGDPRRSSGSRRAPGHSAGPGSIGLPCASSLASRDLWIYGVALLGGYGAYFTTSQLFSEYVTVDRHLDPSTGGLLSALILLAGIPGSLLGGYCADRSRNLRMFVVGPLVVVAALLALIPVVPNEALWALGIGIGFFLIFGFAAWPAVPARVCHIEHEYLGTATGLMLTLAAVGGFFIPIIFGHLVPRTSFDTGWVFLAIVSFAFALLGLAGRNPAGAPAPRR